MNFEPVKYEMNGEDAKFMMVAEESGRYGQRSKGEDLLNNYDDFYNPVNQQKLRNSIERLEKGLGAEHDLVEVDV